MKNAKKFTLCKHLPAFLLVCFFALSALIFGEGFAIRSAAADGYVYDLKGRTIRYLDTYNIITIKDSTGGGSITELKIEENAKVTLESGSISGVSVGGELIINGGSISYVNRLLGAEAPGSVTMNGGTINGRVTGVAFTLNGGTIDGNSHCISTGWSVVEETSKFIMNGGTILAPKGRAIAIQAGSDVVINAGTINAAIAIGVYEPTWAGKEDSSAYSTDVTSCFDEYRIGKPATLTINNGTINGGTATGSEFDNLNGAALELGGLTSITIKGGSFKGSVKIYHSDALTIDKATFTNTLWLDRGSAKGPNKSITILGGNFQNGLDIDESLGDSTVLIKNGTFSSTDDEALSITSKGNGHTTVTIENGTFSSVNRPAVQTNSYKDSSSGLMGSNTVTIENGTFKSTDGSSVAIDENSTFTVKGGTFTGTLYCVASSTASTSPLKLFGGTFYPVNSTERARIILSTNSSSLDILSTLASGYCFKLAGDSEDYLSEDQVWGSSIKVQSGTQQFRLAFKDPDYMEGAKVYSDTKFVTDGSSFGSLPTPPARTGYTFKGWSLPNPVGSTTISDSMVTSSSIFHWKTSKGDYRNYHGVKNSNVGAIWLNAIWEKTSTTPTPTPTPSTGTTYKVSFNANGGKKVASTKKLKTGQVYGALPKTSRKGYTFLGWYTAKTKGTKVTAKTKFTRKSNLTLYAHWKYTTYKITYKTQKGKLSGKYKKTYQMITKTFKLPTPKRTGYTFRGWSTSASKFKKVTQIKKGTTGNKTFYAWWKKNTSTTTPSKTTTYKAPGLTRKYVVGVDIPAEEYYMKPTHSYSTEIVIYKNGKTKCFYDQDTCGYSTIITLSKGTSVSYKGFTAVPISQSKKLASTKKEGMFKVGFHIPAGTYTLKSSEGSDEGYYYIYNSSKPNADYDIKGFTGTTTITLKKGQYLKLSFATIVQ